MRRVHFPWCYLGVRGHGVHGEPRSWNFEVQLPCACTASNSHAEPLKPSSWATLVYGMLLMIKDLLGVSKGPFVESSTMTPGLIIWYSFPISPLFPRRLFNWGMQLKEKLPWMSLRPFGISSLCLLEAAQVYPSLQKLCHLNVNLDVTPRKVPRWPQASTNFHFWTSWRSSARKRAMYPSPWVLSLLNQLALLSQNCHMQKRPCYQANREPQHHKLPASALSGTQQGLPSHSSHKTWKSGAQSERWELQRLACPCFPTVLGRRRQGRRRSAFGWRQCPWISLTSSTAWKPCLRRWQVGACSMIPAASKASVVTSPVSLQLSVLLFFQLQRSLAMKFSE